MLTISEELMLLGVHDDKGSVIMSASKALPYGLATAVLIDLKNLGKIEFEGRKVKLIDYSPTNYDFLDKVLIEIKNKKSEKSITFWIKAIGLDPKEFMNDIFDSLVDQSILSKKSDKHLWLVKFERYPTLDPVPELKTRDRIHKTVLMGLDPDEQLLDLIALMYHCKLVNEVFPKDRRSEAKSAILKMIQGNTIGDVAQSVILEMASSAINT